MFTSHNNISMFFGTTRSLNCKRKYFINATNVISIIIIIYIRELNFNLLACYHFIRVRVYCIYNT